ncbi:hypothetical protein LCGC14_2954410 [marine sediment metagenome]|uniref:Uncharacterized protein n=1 Tax=marine sediment metagenome TaxID=412755 RepID=A0A0F8ZLZ2_9ZZZZ
MSDDTEVRLAARDLALRHGRKVMASISEAEFDEIESIYHREIATKSEYFARARGGMTDYIQLLKSLRNVRIYFKTTDAAREFDARKEG